MFNWFKNKKKTKGFTSSKNLDSDNPMLDFLNQETSRIMEEVDEEKRNQGNHKKIKQQKEDDNKKEEPIDEFINHLQISLKSVVGKYLGNNLDKNDKYLLGFIYGLCDYTNDLHELDNEIGGIGTFLKMHIFFFAEEDLGGIMGVTAKLSQSEEPTFISGAIDGGSAISKEKIYSEPPEKAYQKLVNYLKDNY